MRQPFEFLEVYFQLILSQVTTLRYWIYFFFKKKTKKKLLLCLHFILCYLAITVFQILMASQNQGSIVSQLESCYHEYCTYSCENIIQNYFRYLNQVWVLGLRSGKYFDKGKHRMRACIWTVFDDGVVCKGLRLLSNWKSITHQPVVFKWRTYPFVLKRTSHLWKQIWILGVNNF